MTRLADAWAPYEPGEGAPWDLRRVVHLHRRAGFAAPWEILERDLKDGPEASLARVLGARVRPAPESFEATSRLLADAAVTSNAPERLKAWWVYRMLTSPDPLGERLTLMWHDHFATSNLKVGDLAAMRRQNDAFREHARAPFGRLLNAAVRDPALLAWLDAPANRKGHPNENLARELMELFSLGVGHYTESDVKEAARALTGWTVADGVFREDPDQHDPGEKTIFGRTASWSASDLVSALLDNPATSRRLAWRLCGLFFGEPGIAPAALEALAAGLRAHQLDIGWGVATILRSRAFFDESNLGTRVLGPPEFVLGAAVALGRTDPPPSTMVLADWCARLGQDLFYPPNVGGWPGGRTWLTARSLIGRANYAAALVEGQPVGLTAPLDAGSLATRQVRSSDAEGIAEATSRLVLGVPLNPQSRARVIRTIGGKSSDASNRLAATTILASPEAQLG